MSSETNIRPSSQATGKTGSNQIRLRIAGVLVTIVLLAVAIGACTTPPTPAPQPTSAPQVSEIKTYSNLSQAHTTETVDYPQSPPVGGPHDPVWQNCGFYDQPIRNENAVHSLEHGAVWITYRPDLAEEAVESLRELVDGRSHLLISPYPDLPAPVVATAWGVQLALESPDDPRLLEFITKYLQGPQTPEPGAPCAGGVGTPL